MDAAVWKVTATIDDRDSWKSECSLLDMTPNIILPQPWSEAVKVLPNHFVAHCVLNFTFSRKEATIGEQTLGKREVSQFLDANQGIRIYRDGFRVKPYGQPNGDGDWLRLAFKTRSPEGVSQDAALERGVLVIIK